MNDDNVTQGCLLVDEKIMCYDPAPAKDSDCINLSGYHFCQTDGKDTTFKDELKKSLSVFLYPRVTVDDAKYMKLKIVEYSVGFILAALVFTLSFYIKDIIDIIFLLFIPSSPTILTLFIVIISLTSCAFLFSFLEYRMYKAVNNTSVLEKLSEKSPLEVLNTISLS